MPDKVNSSYSKEIPSGFLLLLFNVFLMLSLNVSGQTYVSRQFGVDEGLLENRIYAMLQHPNGILFVGTGIGLNVFDGENMLEVPSGSHEPVRSILPYKQDSIILVKESSVCIMSAKNYHFRESKYFQATENLLTQGILVNNILYCSSLKGLVKIELNSMKYTFMTLGLTNTKGNLYSTIFPTITYSPNTNSIYYGSRYGFVIYRLNSATVIKSELVNNTSCELLNENSRISRVYFRNGNLYYQVRSGKVNVYNEKTGKVHVPDMPGARHVKFSSNSIYLQVGDTLLEYNYNFNLLSQIPLEQFQAIADIQKNRRNEYLLATHDGLVVIRKNSNAIIEVPVPDGNKFGFIELQSKMAYEDFSYLSTKKGIIELDSNMSFSQFYPLPKESLEVIHGIITYKDNNLLVLGSGGYLGFNLKTKKYYRPHLFSDSMEKHIALNSVITGNYDSITSHVLFCLHRNPMVLKDLNTGEESRWDGNDSGWFNAARCLTYAGNYDYFFGSNNTNGVIRYNFKTRKGKHYGKAVFGKLGIIHATIQRLKFYDGRLFIATIKGITILDTSNQNMIRVTLETKYFSDNFFSMNVIDGKLYTASGNALYLYQSNNTFGTIYSFKRERECGIPFGKNEQIHFINSSNFIHLDLKKLNKINSITVSHVIQGNKFYNVSKHWQITTPYSSENTTLMIGTDLYIKEKVPFKLYYRLAANNNWNLVRNYRIHLGSLKYGKNQIMLYTNQQGNVNNTYNFTIFMRRPWWASYQFYILCGIVGMLLLWWFVRWSIQSKIRKERTEVSLVLNSIDSERNRISADFHDGIGPNLSTIKLISEMLKSDKQQDLLLQLSDLIDETMLSIREVINELSPQYLQENGLEMALKQFIHLTAKRYPLIQIKLKCKLSTVRYKEIIETNIFRLCQEAVSNAVKHANPTEIVVLIEDLDNSMLISICDNGTFQVEGINQGLGLSNMRTRAKLLNGEFNILHGHNTNTEVKIILPLKA